MGFGFNQMGFTQITPSFEDGYFLTTKEPSKFQL